MPRLLIVSLLLVATGVALAANPDHLGKEAPSLKFTQFADIAVPAKTVADLRGDVVLMVYVRTSCPGCRGIFGTIAKTAERFARPDVHVFTITNDSRNLTRRYMVHQAEGRAINHPVAIRVNGDWGVRALPMAYLIGRDGKIVWSGYRDTGFTKALEAAIAAPDPALPEGWKGAKKALADISKERFAKALAAARKAKEDEGSAAAAAYVEKRVETHLDRAILTADRHLAAGDVWSARETLAAAEKAFEGTDLVTKLSRKRDAIEARDDYEAVAPRWKELAGIWSAARKSKKGVKAGIGKLKALKKKCEDAKLVAAIDEMLAVFGKPWTQEDAMTMGGLLKNPPGCDEGV